MERLIGTMAVLALSSGLLASQKPVELNPLRFEPGEIMSTVNTYYPPLSVAFGTVVFQLTIGELGEIEESKSSATSLR